MLLALNSEHRMPSSLDKKAA